MLKKCIKNDNLKMKNEVIQKISPFNSPFIAQTHHKIHQILLKTRSHIIKLSINLKKNNNCKHLNFPDDKLLINYFPETSLKIHDKNSRKIFHRQFS